MIQLRQVGPNHSVLIQSGKSVLFSYGTPVAFYDANTFTAYKAEKGFSKTTTKYVKKFLAPFTTPVLLSLEELMERI